MTIAHPRSATETQTACTFQNCINGRWLAAETDRFVPRHNPANLDDVVGYVPLTPKTVVDLAIEVASGAAAPWQSTPAPTRGKVLLKVARLLEDRAATIAQILTREQGKTLVEAHEEVDLAIKVLEYMSGVGRRLAGETLPSERHRSYAYTRLKPLGVVGLITPWNFPLAVPLWKIAPALVCGNTVVWKPSRLTPLTSQFIAQLFLDVELPDGVLNVLHGSGSEAGAAIVHDPRVRGISFTSSFEVGTRIYSEAARQFKKVQCEAGGKNAVVVLADANLALAAQCIATGAFRYAGQRCTATSRVVVLDSVADALVRLLVERAESIVVGNGLEPSTDMGPVADELQLQRILHFLDVGATEGRLVCGGRRLTGSRYDRGYFVGPTIFDEVRVDAQVAQEEIFGPVLSIIRVRSVAEAVEAVNLNRYGLAASVFGTHLDKVFDTVEQLDCGMVHVNGSTIRSEVHLPFGGIKDAGVGQREMGSPSIDFYTEPQVVYVHRE